MRLRTKFAIALLAVTVILSGATFAGLEFYKAQAVGDVEQNVAETATVVADQIDRRLRERRDFIGYIASRPQAARFERSGPYLDSFLANSRFYAAQIIAANGTVVAFRGDITAQQRRQVIGSDRSNATYFNEGLEGAYIGAPEFTTLPNRPDTYVVIISAPIFGADKNVTGVLAAALFLNENTVFGMVPAAETSVQQVTITNGEQTLYQPNRRFNETVQAAATVKTTDWRVTVVRDRSGLNRRLEQLAIFQGVALFVVLFTMIGFGYWQYSVSLRQTERLLDGFERIQEGDYDYEVVLSGGTEWERISDGANELAAGLQRREAALRERQQRLEVLHRVLRHNVRNRMSIVLNYAGIISDMTDDDLIVDATGTIEDAAEDLTRLSEKAAQVESVLDETEPEPEPVEVASIVRDVVRDAAETAPGLVTSVEAPDTAWAMTLPGIRLAVENAVENAYTHNESESPRVWATVEETSTGRVRIEIADNGPGIPDQDRLVIEEGTETDLEHGSGLGLWVIYWIVDNSNGELTFDNTDEGALVRMEFASAAPPTDSPDVERALDAEAPSDT